MSSTEAPPDLLTLDDWANLDKDVPGEWVDGVLVEEEVPSFIHELLVGILTEQFRRWLGRGALIAGSESKLAVGPSRGRKPDLSVWFPGSPLPPAEASMSRVPPDVAVEIVTPTPRDVQRDRVTKHNEYAAFGIRYYWIVDPSVRSLEVFELRAGVYSRVLGVTSGSALTVPGIESAQLNLDEVWEEVDDFIRRSAEQNP
jgi:Uma2 family endonuclease